MAVQSAHRVRVIAVIGSVALVFLMASAVAFSQARSASLSQPAKGEVGTYQLLKMTSNGKDELYRINTKTGQVWLFSEYAVLTSDDLDLHGDAKAGLDKLLADARKQGKNLYTMPFWDLTAETRPDRFTIH